MVALSVEGEAVRVAADGVEEGERALRVEVAAQLAGEGHVEQRPQRTAHPVAVEPRPGAERVERLRRGRVVRVAHLPPPEQRPVSPEQRRHRAEHLHHLPPRSSSARASRSARARRPRRARSRSTSVSPSSPTSARMDGVPRVDELAAELCLGGEVSAQREGPPAHPALGVEYPGVYPGWARRAAAVSPASPAPTITTLAPPVPTASRASGRARGGRAAERATAAGEQRAARGAVLVAALDALGGGDAVRVEPRGEAERVQEPTEEGGARHGWCVGDTPSRAASESGPLAAGPRCTASTP
jgi:hypothetical protein